MRRRSLFGAALAMILAGPAYGQQMIGNCAVLPADNIWNTAVDTLPVLSNSTTMVNTIGASRGFHADFGAGMWDGGPIGIPFITVTGSQTKYPATFLYDDESDPGPYAVPLNAPIEGGPNADGDRHAIAIDTTNCTLYELYRAFPQGSSWEADSGAIYDLRSNALRPASWTSADAAGLPLTPGLVTFDEVASGEIRHAIRFTVPQTRREYVWPARHYASSLTGTQYPRMGERFRLKASFDISSYPPTVQVILKAMKKYGILLADNGSAWYVSGKPDSRWNDDDLRSLSRLLGSNFEAVDATVLRISPDSGAARQSGTTVTVTPSAASVRVGQLRAFSASVAGAAAGVTWSVNGVSGGDAVNGTIDTTGHYLAPPSVPSPAVVTVRATSTATSSASAAASVTVLPLPSIASVSPASFPVGAFTLRLTGTGFVSGATVTMAGSPVTVTSVSATVITVSGNAAAAVASVPVVATMPDGAVTNAVYVTVIGPPPPPPSPVTIAVTPATLTARLRRGYRFTATVQGTANTAVQWKVNGVIGGNTVIGTIGSKGGYIAPKVVPSPAVVTVSATSMADPTKTASSTVTIARQNP